MVVQMTGDTLSPVVQMAGDTLSPVVQMTGDTLAQRPKLLTSVSEPHLYHKQADFVIIPAPAVSLPPGVWDGGAEICLVRGRGDL